MRAYRLTRRWLWAALAMGLPLVLFGLLRSQASWRPRVLRLPRRMDSASIAFSPDGRLLAAGDAFDLYIWDVASRHLRRVCHELFLGGINGRVRQAVAFLPDGRTVADLRLDGEVALWNISSGRLQGTIAHGRISSMACSKDGRYLVTGGRDVRVWDLGSRRVMRILSFVASPPGQPADRHPRAVEAVAFCPDGALVAATDWETVRLWDWRTGQLRRVLKHRPSRHEYALAFSPDGRLLAVGTDRISLHDTKSGGLMRELDKDPSRPNSTLSFAARGGVLAAAESNTAIGLWDFHTGQLVRRLKNAHEQLTEVAFSADGTTLACSNEDSTIVLWRVR